MPAADPHLLVLFDTRLRADAWGVSLLKAFRELDVQYVHYEPCELAAPWTPVFRGYQELNLAGASAVLCIDDEINWELPQTDLPMYYWVIDAWRIDYPLYISSTRRERARHFRRVAWSQRKQAREMSGPWIPVAVDTDLYNARPLDAAAHIYDWCFIGHMNEARRGFCDTLLRALPDGFVGQVYGAEANRMYNQSRLAINLSQGGDVNLRMFEAQATNALCISSRVDNGEDELFESLPLFANADECITEMKRWLGDSPGRAVLSERQQAEMARHSWRARARSLLRMMELL